MTQPTTPSVGRIVHAREYAGGECQAALVTYVHSDRLINVVAFTANGLPVARTSVRYAEPTEDEAYTWHWPERV